MINMQGQVVIQKTGLSRYQENGRGIIEFDWAEDELKQINQPIILQIILQDDLTKENKMFRIKTSTLK
jgi:hypothetical protein